MYGYTFLKTKVKFLKNSWSENPWWRNPVVKKKKKKKKKIKILCSYQMNPEAKKSIFVGYGIGVEDKHFDTDTSKVFHSRDVIFNETASIS